MWWLPKRSFSLFQPSQTKKFVSPLRNWCVPWSLIHPHSSTRCLQRFFSEFYFWILVFLFWECIASTLRLALPYSDPSYASCSWCPSMPLCPSCHSCSSLRPHTSWLSGTHMRHLFFTKRDSLCNCCLEWDKCHFSAPRNPKLWISWGYGNSFAYVTHFEYHSSHDTPSPSIIGKQIK